MDATWEITIGDLFAPFIQGWLAELTEILKSPVLFMLRNDKGEWIPIDEKAREYGKVSLFCGELREIIVTAQPQGVLLEKAKRGYTQL